MADALPLATRLYLPAKRAGDAAAAFVGLLLLLPLLAVLAALIRLRLGAPVLFTQQRPGRHGRPFMVVKFRTMSDARNAAGELLSDAERLPPFGRFLRACSLDELPQLWCVLRGEMSLVGPRPLLMKYLPLYSDTQARRHLVRPGITGWAQVHGRNAISWQEKFACDVWYVDHCSPWLDLRILALTMLKVVVRDGVSRPGCATTVEFTGNPPSAQEVR